MKTNYNKKLINYHVDKNLLIEFDKVAKENAINKSVLIELFIRKWVEEHKDKTALSN